MTHDDFVALLDAKNPRYAQFARFITAFPEDFCFARKGNDLVEVVERFREVGRDPLIDKKLRMVIGCVAHRSIRAEMYRYHKALVPPENKHLFSIEEDSSHADAYTAEGMGYHFSSMVAWAPMFGGRIRPIVGDKYRPDRLDRDLFRFYCESDPL